MPARMWSATWQWNSQVPGSSGSMSATTMLAGRSDTTSVRIPAAVTTFPGHSLAGHDDRAHEPGVDVVRLVDVRVVHPHHRAEVVRARTGTLGHPPPVGVRAARRHGIAVVTDAVGVGRPLRVLVVEDTVG